MPKSPKLTESQWLAEIDRIAAESRPHKIELPPEVVRLIDIARNRPRPLSWPKLTKLLMDNGALPPGSKSHTIAEIWRKQTIGC